jgi:hypothetical protein
MLAMAICLNRYMKQDLSSTARGLIKHEWLTRWKDQLGNPEATPRQVMRLYVDELDITVACLDDKMDWDAWDDSDGNTMEDQDE